MMEVVVARKAGACYGVSRALQIAEQVSAQAQKPVYTLGPLIHNPRVIASLEARGVTAVDDPLDAADGSAIIMRAHGVTPALESHAADAGLQVVDATCPYVKKVHKAVERLERDGFRVVIVGEAGHPEVEGTRGHGHDVLVLGSAQEAKGLEYARRIGVVVQTTLSREVLREVVAALIGRCEELRIVDTICEATSERQQAAVELAQTVDVMVVVGGRGSANTRHLHDLCKEVLDATYHVESAEELESVWFEGAQRVGVTAGASTPASHIDSVCKIIRQL